MSEIVKYVLIAALLSAALAAAAVAVAAPALGFEAEKSALIAAFPVTERVSAAINLMISQKEDGFVNVELPAADCYVSFYAPKPDNRRGRYVETKMFRGAVSATYGLFILEDIEAPERIDCGGLGGGTVRVRVERRGERVVVSRA